MKNQDPIQNYIGVKAGIIDQSVRLKQRSLQSLFERL
jgi:hypothetical protein